MRISKTLVVACVGLLCASPGLVRAGDDNDAQARARAALQEKMNQLNNQPAPAVSSESKPAATAPMKAPAKQPAVETNAVVITAPNNTSDATYDKLSQAVDQKWQQIESSKTKTGSQVYQPLPASAGKPAPAMKPTKKVQSETQKAATSPAVETSKPTKTVKEQKALNKALAKPAVARTPPSELPMMGPPPPITASQQQQLNSLLQLYQTDQVTPEQYHERRAKILGEK